MDNRFHQGLDKALGSSKTQTGNIADMGLNKVFKLNSKVYGATSLDDPTFQEHLPYIKNAEKYAREELGYDIPHGLLPSIFDKESTAGKNSSQYNPALGESAWMLGMATEGQKRLKEIGYKGDYISKQGVFNSAVKLLSDKSKVFDYNPKTNTKTINQVATDKYTSDPSSLYSERYYAGKDKKVYNVFKKKFEYYSKSDY